MKLTNQDEAGIRSAWLAWLGKPHTEKPVASGAGRGDPLN